MSTVQQQRKVVDQLRREQAIRRMPVSHAIDDLKVKLSWFDMLSNDWFPEVYHG